MISAAFQLLSIVLFIHHNNCASSTLAISKIMTDAHTDTVSAISISQDLTIFASGSYDHDLKIWDLASKEALNNKTYTDWVTAVGINNANNEIYVSTFVSDFSVVSSADYSQLNAAGLGSYPNSGQGSTIQFNSDNTFAYIAGYSDTMTPQIHKFDTTTYLQVGPATSTNFLTNSQVVSMQLLSDSLAVVVDNVAVAPFFIKIYDLSSQTLIQTIQLSTAELTEVQYNSDLDVFFVTSKDQSIRSYSKSPINSQYQLTSKVYLNTFGTGIPRQLSSEVQGYLFALVDTYLVEYEVDSVGRLTYSQNFSFTQVGQSIDIHQPYVIVGCDAGQVRMYEFPIVTSPSKSQTKQNSINQLIIIGAVLVGLAAMALSAFLISRFCCENVSKIDPQLKNKQKNKQERNITVEQLSFEMTEVDLDRPKKY